MLAMQVVRSAALQLCKELDQCPPDDFRRRKELLRQLIPNSRVPMVESGFQVEYGIHCRIGKGTFINHNVSLIDEGQITIGNQVLIGPNSLISTVINNDTLPNKLTINQRGDVYIGHRVWIGANVVITAGVHIGDNSVIGAGSHVSLDVPANSVVVGNPAICLRKIQ